MLILLTFNAFLIALGIGAALSRVPPKFVTAFLHGLHGTIGITAPTPNQVRWALVVWIASIAVIVDVLWLMMIYVF